MLTQRAVERSYPWIIGSCTGILSGFVIPQGIYQKVADKLVDPIITISTIAIGFLMTVTTMLISMERRAVIQELRGIGAYQILLGYLKSSIYAWFVVAIVSVAVVLIDPSSLVPILGYPWLRIAFALWAALGASSVLTSYRVARVMFALLRHKEPARPQSRQSDQENYRELAAAR